MLEKSEKSLNCLKQIVYKATALLTAFCFSTLTLANPVPDHVAAGQISIQSAPNSTLNVIQSSQQGIINWKSFNINQHETTHFQQPAGGITLNRVTGPASPSQIYGRLTATGQIILVNPAGIFFGPTAVVNVGGLIATTANISDQDFLNRYYNFSHVGPNSASVVNQGHIIAADHGLVALIGSNVHNNGLIQANLGKVVLASGQSFHLSFAGNEMIGFSVNEKTLNPGTVSNTGILRANGGAVLVTAKAAQGVLDNVINMAGVVEAKSVTKQNGEIILGDVKIAGDRDAGVVRVASNINVSGRDTGQKGGDVAITGYNILLDSPTHIDASGDLGGGTIRIGGNYQGKGPLPNANALLMAPEATLLADATRLGNGGEIILWANELTRAYGSISAKGGSLGGDGGFVETSAGHLEIGDNIYVNTSAPYGKAGTWLLDPYDITLQDATTTNGSFAGGNFTPTGDNAVVSTTTIQSILNGGTNVTISTGLTGSAGTQTGNITVASPISWSTAASLTLTAAGAIAINAAITTGLAASSLVLNAVGNVTQSALIQGAGQVIKQGAGTWFASQANTYSGGSTLSTGTIAVENNSGLGSGTITINGGTIAASLAARTLNNPLQLNANFTLGQLTHFTNNITLGSNIQITMSGVGNSSILSGNITDGASTFSLSTTGGSNGAAIVLSGTNDYGGGTSVNGGRLNIASSNALGTGNLTVSSGAVLGISGNISPTNNMTISGTGLGSGVIIATGTNTLQGNITLGAASSISAVSSSDTLTINGNISGGHALTKVGSGVLALNGSNSFNGGLNFNEGVILVGTNAALGSASNNLVFNGGTLRAAATFTAGSAHNITLNAGGGTFDPASLTSDSNAPRIAGAITGTGALTIYDSVNGLGEFIFTNSGNTYSGNTNINSGGFAMGENNSLSPNSTVVFGSPGLGYLRSSAAGRTINNTINANANFRLGQLTTLNGSMVLGANVTITPDTGTNDSTIGGVISETGGARSLNILAPSGSTAANTTQLVFSGNNTYSGGTFIDGSRLQISSNNNLGGANGGITFSNGGRLTTTATFTLGSTRNITLGTNGGTLNVASGTTLTYGGVLSGTGSLSKTSAGTLILSGANTHSGTFAIDAGTVQLGASNVIANTSAITLANTSGAVLNLNNFSDTIGSLAGGGGAGGNVTLGSGTLTIGGDNTSTSYSGIISGSGNLAKTGSGTTTLQGINTFSGSTTITGGALSIGADSGLGNAPGAATANHLVLNGGTLATSATFTLNTNRGLSLGASNGTISPASGTTLSYGGILAGAGGLTKSNAGALTLSGVNTYGGSTTISDGTLNIAADSGLGTVPGVATAGHLVLNGGTLATTNTFTLETNRGISLGSSGGTFNVNTATTLSYGGIIAGSGALTKTSTGTLALSGSNTYSGLTTVSAGQISAFNDNAFGSTAAGTVVSSGAAANLSGTFGESFTISGTGISNAGAITGDAGISSSATITLAADSAIGTPGFSQIEAPIGGSFALTKVGAGVLLTTAANTYTGLTTVSAGTLMVLNNSSLGTTAAGTVVASGATLDVNGATISNETLTLNGGTLNSTTNGGTWAGPVILGDNSTISGSTGTPENNFLTVSGVISGGFTLTKGGTMPLVLSGANTYTGATNVTGGTLRLGASNTIPNNSAVTIDAGTILNLNGFSDTIGSIAGAGNVTLGAGTLTTGGNNSDTTLSGIISGSGGLTKEGSGIFTLSGLNTYTGTTTVNAGTLRSGISGFLSDSTAVVLANAANTILDFNGNDETFGSLAGGGTTGGNILLNSATITFGNSNNTSYGGIISGDGNVIKNGSGSFTVTGSNTFTGNMVVNAGTLILGTDTPFNEQTAIILQGGNLGSTGDRTVSNTVTVNNSFVLSENMDLAGNINLGGDVTITLDASNNNNSTISGIFDDDVNNYHLTFARSGTTTGTSAIIITSANTYSGGTTIQDGAVTITDANALGTGAVTVDNGAALNIQGGISPANNITLNGTGLSNTGALRVTGNSNVIMTGNVALGSNTSIQAEAAADTLSLQGVVSGGFTLDKIGSGVLTLTGNNTYSGQTTVTAGTLQVANANALGTTAAGTVVSNGATLRVAGGTSVGAEALTINGTGIGGLGALTGTGTSSYAGAITLGSASSIGTDFAGSTFTLSGAIGGGFDLTKVDVGTLILSNAGNNYTGTTTITNGSLRLGASGVLPDGTAVSLANAADANLDLNGFNETIASLSGGGGTGGNVDLGAGTLTTGNASNTTYAGVISDSGNLIKQGSGTFTLSGANTFTGATTINAGAISIAADSGLGTAPGAATANQLVLNGGTLITSSSFTLNANRGIALGASGGTIQTGSGTTLTYNGIMAGVGNALTKTGTGTLTLGGANAYTGTTTVSAGTLQSGASGVLADTTALTVAGSATYDLNDFNETIGSLTGAGNLTLGSGTLTVGDATSTTFSGVISEGGNLTKVGTGVLTLSNNNTYSGLTTISNGTLRMGTANALSSNSSIDDIAATAVLDLNGNNLSIGYIQGAGNISLGAGTLTTTTTFATTLSGVISGSGGIIKAGTGLLRLSGANTYTGQTTVTGGNLWLLGNNALNSSSALSLAAGTGFNLNGFDTSVGALTGSGDVELGANTLTIGSSNTDFTYSGAMTGSGGNIVKEGTGTFTFSGTSGNIDDIDINNGILLVNNAAALNSLMDVSIAGGANLNLNNFSVSLAAISGAGDINLGSGTLSSGGSGTLSGVIAGSGGFTKETASTLTLSGANTYTGTTTVSAGTLSIDNASGLGTTAGGTSVLSGATLHLNDINIGTEAITLNNGTLSATGTNAAGSGAISLVASSSNTINSNAGAALVLAGDINGAAALTLQGAGQVSLSGNIGNTDRLTSLTTHADSFINSQSVSTTGNQTYGNPFNIGQDSTFDSSTGNLTFNGTIDGDTTDFGLTLISAGTTTFGSTVGATTALNNLTVTAAGLTINGGVVRTIGDQTYNAPVTLLSNTTLTTEGTGSAAANMNIALNNGVSGNLDLAFASGAAGNYNYTLGGTLALNTVSIAGSAAGNNTFVLNTSTDQAWSLTGANASNIATSGVTGGIALTNINTLTGGSANDTFTLSGGTLSGSLSGGAGTNVLIADNTANTWGITGANTGTLTGIGGTFSDIQNLTGGTGADNFSLNGGTISGSVQGGGGTNTITADNTANTWSITGGSSGSVTGISGTFADIQNLIGGSGTDTFTLSGGTVGGSIDGSGGTNTLAANNVANSWNVTSTDAGSVTGVSGTFSNIQNLIGGSVNNTFTFADGATISGEIVGSSPTNTNTFNYASYASPMTVTLSSQYDGVLTNGGGTIAAFRSINYLEGNPSVSNTFITPLSVKTNNIEITGANPTTSAITGFLNDPIFFDSFNTFIGTGGDVVSFGGLSFTVISSSGGNLHILVNGVNMFFNGFILGSAIPSSDAINTVSVADIIQQSLIPPDAVPTNPIASWLYEQENIGENIDSLNDAFKKAYQDALEKLKITLNCMES